MAESQEKLVPITQPKSDRRDIVLLKPVAVVLTSAMLALGWIALYFILGTRTATTFTLLAWLGSVGWIARARFGRAYALSLGLVPGVLVIGAFIEWIRKII